MLQKLHDTKIVSRSGRNTLLWLFAIRSRPIQYAPLPPQDRRLDVYTFVTSEEHYVAMRESFAQAGFHPSATRFVRLSDQTLEPFAAIRAIGEQQEGAAPYALLCHQDVRIDQGAGAKELFDRLADLDAKDPGWAVAGDAGVTENLRIIRRIEDRYGGSSHDDLPTKVVSLDENFLILNRRNKPRCSAGVAGFHFYGVDVCLNALVAGHGAYAIDFPVTHLGAGGMGEGYRRVRERFLKTWRPRFHVLRILGTPSEVLVVTRWRPLERLLGSDRVMRWLNSNRGEWDRMSG